MGIINRKDLEKTREFQNQILDYLDKINVNNIDPEKIEKIKILKLKIKMMEPIESKSSGAVQESLLKNIKGFIADLYSDGWFFDDYFNAIIKNISDRIVVDIKLDIMPNEAKVRDIYYKLERNVYNSEFSKDNDIKEALKRLIFKIKQDNVVTDLTASLLNLETAMRGESKIEVLSKIESIQLNLDFPNTSTEKNKTIKEFNSQIELINNIINRYRNEISNNQKQATNYNDMINETKAKLTDRNVTSNIALGKKLIKDVGEYQKQQTISFNNITIFQNAAEGMNTSLSYIKSLFAFYSNMPERQKALVKFVSQYIKSIDTAPEKLQEFFDKIRKLYIEEGNPKIVTEVELLDATSVELAQEMNYSEEELALLNSLNEDAQLNQAATDTYKNIDKISNKD